MKELNAKALEPSYLLGYSLIERKKTPMVKLVSVLLISDYVD